MAPLGPANPLLLVVRLGMPCCPTEPPAPPGPGFQDFNDRGASVLRLALGHFHQQAITGHRARNEQRHSLHTREPVAAGNELLDHHLRLLEVGERRRRSAQISR